MSDARRFARWAKAFCDEWFWKRDPDGMAWCPGRMAVIRRLVADALREAEDRAAPRRGLAEPTTSKPTAEPDSP